MSQNTLIEKIKNDAAATVAEINATATTQVEGIQREIEAQVTELQNEHEATLKKTKAQMELVAVSKAKQAGNIAVQTAKRKKIDTIFAGVTKDLQAQTPEEYVTFFAKYLTEIVPKDAEIISVHVPAERVAETNDILKEVGVTGEVAADAEVTAGMVVHTKDGVYDITLARLMNDKRPELEMVVVNKVMA
jgi:vacuolar-type H+-ATPase subunit E/Vma4